MKTSINDEQQSKTLNALRFPLACLVVIIHCKLSEEGVMPQWSFMTGDDFTKAIQIIFSSIISGVAVPIFFVISGYYFFYNTNGGGYKSKLKKRVGTLLLPYVLWNSILILKYVSIKLVSVILYDGSLSEIIDFLKSYGGLHMFWDCYVWPSGKPDILGCSAPLNSAPFLFPLWYVRDLMVVVLFSPVLYMLLRRFKYWVLMIFAVSYITGFWPEFHGFSVISFLFFSVGAYFGIHNKNMVNEFRKYTKVSWILYLVLFAYLVFINTGVTPQSSYVYSLFIIIGVVAVINFSSWLYEKGKLEWCIKLKETTFFIYAFHLVLGTQIASMILNAVLPLQGHWAFTLLCYMLKPVLTVLVSIVIYYMLKKCCPRMLAVLTGTKSNIGKIAYKL